MKKFQTGVSDPVAMYHPLFIKKWPALLVIIGILFSGCKENRKEPPLFTLKKNTGIDFANTVTNSPDFNIFSYRNFYNGGGVGIGDINNDGLADVVFTANMGGNKLYLNKGNWIFEDISARAGFLPDKKDWSTGVVLADINQDGWLDIFICNAGYINNQKPRCQLFINNKDLSFTEKAAEYGLLNEGGYTTHAAFFDYDLDGDLDCFIINNSFIPVNTLNYANKRNLRAPDWPVADFLKGGGDHLYRNDKGRFTDVSKEAGIYGSLISFGLGVTIGDINGDHYPDIYVSNDFFERDYLYINQQNGTFRDELESRVQHISHSSMGADMADINNDGYPDIFTTDMLPDDDYRLKTTTSFDQIDVNRLKQQSGFYNQYTQNTLQVNNRNGRFLETAFFSGVAASDWSWGGLIFDADNDGRSDIFVCNGIYHDVTNQDFIDFFANDVIQKMVMTGEKGKFDEIVNKMPSQPLANKFYHNSGGLSFREEEVAAGLGTPSFSNGSAYGDLDNDGDLDLVVNNVNAPAFVYRNNSREDHPEQNYIALRLTGDSANRFAVGSQVKIYQGPEVISRELIPTRGFQSCVDYKMVIGLGKGSIDSLIITWPDKRETVLIKPAVNKLLLLSINTATRTSPVTAPSAPTWFSPLPATFDKHTEDDYIDFYTERNIAVMLSREGPHADTADVNGDGLTDVFVGGAAGQPGQLYLQQNGRLVKKATNVFENDRAFEDVAVLFFDADQDGDKDLFIGSGGNAQPAGSDLYQHRLYLNDGHGNFSRASQSFPSYRFNSAAALAFDADADGDLDLFVASRSVPQQYGQIPDSYLYLNNGKGVFSTSSSIKAGMLTDAAITDINADHKPEVIVTGEWMPPRIYGVQDHKLIELGTGMESMLGWWQSLAVADLDGDGDQDLVLGNIGENCYLRPDSRDPVKLWINDFDNNGTQDNIITRRIAGRDMPVFLKRELTEQLPSLKKQNLRFEEYARKSVQDLFGKNLVNQSRVMEFNYPVSVVAINDGKGQFSVSSLPVWLQLSCINSILCTDINRDGKPDLVLGGNQFYLQPQFARLDASYGHILLNRGLDNGRMKWEEAEPARTGWEITGEIRDIRQINIGGESCLFILQNNQYPLLYRSNLK